MIQPSAEGGRPAIDDPEAIKDPWGREFQYDAAGSRNGGSRPDIWTVAPNGKTYSGTFDFKLWPPSFDAVGVGNPVAEVTGTTLGTRITVD